MFGQTGLVGHAPREATTLVVHGITDRLPRTVAHDTAFVAWVLVGHLEHADVRIGVGIVGIDALIIGPSAEVLAITWVGEIHGIGHLHLTTLLAVAEQEAILGNIAPCERHEHLTTLLGSIAPESLLQGLWIIHKACAFH